ncbi:hypothetical protein KM295_11030 [Natronomonas sp. F2-12]|uniref:Uncharacterized protein n=1 Tax=Natronomonas aquatica TaxID=2841590 RepID=A0A9R1CU42_9EURY|nr:hypothetical protein [Natronomonas aquatica]MCQ4334007.1 hypothetical protein [Natronomonas aquatica]
MVGARVLVVALLLSIAPIGGVVVADTSGEDTAVSQSHPLPQQTAESDRLMTVVTPENTSEYLAPPPGETDRNDGRRTGLDVAAAVETDARGLESAYRRSTLERRYRDADSDAERREIVENGIDRLAERVDELRQTERTAVRRYSDGEIDTRELLWTLSVVSQSASETDATLEWLETTADEIGAERVAERAAAERVRLVPTDGPVRTRLVTALAGGSPGRIHVETAADGIVIATVDPATDTYLREAYDPTAKTEGVDDQFGENPSPALERFGELYPWSIDSFSSISMLGPEQARLYRFGATHSHGNLETYLDGGSADVLYERQWINVREAPSSNVGRTDGDLRVIATTTRAGGPIGIAVRDTTTGRPVDGDVALNGDPIGSTGGDQLWTVAPHGQTTINATYEGETISLDVDLE